MSGMDNKKLAVIHIAKSALGMGDDEYHALLYGMCRVRSARDIRTSNDFLKLMRAFEQLGYSRDGGRYASGYAGGHGAQWSKAKALWLELYRLGAVRVKSERALESFARKMDVAGTSAGLSRVIEHLKCWLKRVSARTQTGVADR